MNFTLENTGPVGNDISTDELNTISERLDTLTEQLNAIQEALRDLVVDYNGFKDRTSQYESVTSRALSDIRFTTTRLGSTINGLSNQVTTRSLNATDASISNATIQRLKADSLVDLPEIEPRSINTQEGTIDELSSDVATVGELHTSNATVGDLEVQNLLTVHDFNIQNLTSSDLDTESADIEEARISKLSVGNVPIECEDVSYSGWTNGYLHKLDVKANGVLIFKLNEASIVVTPGDISSNYDKLYAAYRTEDGYWHIYFDTDLEGQLLVIGTSDFAITDSLVLKTSVRRNADSNGQPNNGESIKVAVVTQLPRVGQRNVIYVVLGDCAYYCDGQYFYEMASKKRN